MARIKGYALGVMSIDDGEYNNQYSIRVTQHGKEQMEKRNISAEDVVDSIQRIPSAKILYLQEEGRDVCAIDKFLGISVVFSFHGNRIMVVTVFDECDQVFAKNRTHRVFV